MRRIDAIVVHQSDSTFGNAAAIDEWHRERGWSGIGYHRVILNGWVREGEFHPALDGAVEKGRPLAQVGAHVRGHNETSIGICLIGIGDGLPVGQGYVTPAQWKALVKVCGELMERFGVPVERVVGHRDFPGVTKTCPGFDVGELRAALGERTG